MTGFEEAYQALNTAQREAVDMIDGPLLVIAGPGTGKTQLLSARVANILRKTDTDPSAILCLTFTNKAATNMRDRLLQLTGPAARQVMVKTFHSFAAEVMNMYPDYFWSGARLSVASDAVQLEIIESILADLPLANPLSLKFAGQFTAVKPVQNALKLTKEAGLTPEKLHAIVTLNIAYIDEIEPLLVDALSTSLNAKKLDALQATIDQLPPQGISDDVAPLLALDTVIRESLAFAISQDKLINKATQTGKWKSRWLQMVDGTKSMATERQRNAWWLALADVYEQYRTALHMRGYYDYADMLVEVITQLEARVDLRASVQERFLYVLIDEFQDTNAAQLRLSQLVADHFSADGRPNIMAVGDDDQSIYKFNGAELNNMLSFQRMYPSAKLLVLTNNYRSSQAVLDTAARVIELAADRLVKREPNLQKTLHAVNEPAAPSIITHSSYPTRDHQLSDVARLVHAEYIKDPSRHIAVLARNHDSLRRLTGLLAAGNVPLNYEQSNDILSHEAVRLLISLSQLVVAIQTGDEFVVNDLLARVLRHPMWQIDSTTLWKLAIANSGNPQWLDSLLNHHDTKVQNIGHWLLWVAREADQQALGIVMEYLIGLRASEHLTSPLREYFMQGAITTEYMEALSAIKLLLSLVSEFARSTQKTLAEFVQFVQVMENNGQVIADSTAFVSHAQAIELYTIHKAKGLEFDSIYVIDAIEKNWQPTSGGRKPPANLPLQPNGDDADDYVRLMYVALTRAKQHIHVASYRSDDTGQEVLATPLVRSTIIQYEEIAAESANQTVAVLEDSLHWPRLPHATEKQLLKSRLEQYTLSATHLLNFLDVTQGGPANFLETSLLKLPHAQTAEMAFGNAIHASLEQAQKQVNAGGLDIGRIQSAYERTLQSQQLTRGDYDRYSIFGQDILNQLFDTFDYTLPAGSLPEQQLSVSLPGNIALYGKLDRIDTPTKDSLVIVDYKTGTPLTSFTTHDQTKMVKAWRHQTQLLFYALLAKHSTRFKSIQTIEGCIVYIKAANKRTLELRYTPTAAELERLQRLLERVWQHIMDLNTPDVGAYTPDISGIRQFEQDLLDNKI